MDLFARSGHCLAALATALAALGTALHLSVRILVRLAQFGARHAYLGALGAHVRVVGRAPRHEVGAHRANLRAVQQRHQVLRLRVTCARVQDGLRTNLMAVQTRFDAVFHCLARLILLHDLPPLRGWKIGAICVLSLVLLFLIHDIGVDPFGSLVLGEPLIKLLDLFLLCLDDPLSNRLHFGILAVF